MGECCLSHKTRLLSHGNPVRVDGRDEMLLYMEGNLAMDEMYEPAPPNSSIARPSEKALKGNLSGEPGPDQCVKDDQASRRKLRLADPITLELLPR
jgi:hypothetical protein